MTRDEAIDHVIGIATMWGENAEEAYPRRITKDMTDDDLRELLKGSEDLDQDDLEDARSIRDLWIAIDVLTNNKPRPLSEALGPTENVGSTNQE